MALILAAGVLSIGHLEADTGAGTVPGLVVIDAPWLDARRRAEAFDGVRLRWTLDRAGAPLRLRAAGAHPVGGRGRGPLQPLPPTTPPNACAKAPLPCWWQPRRRPTSPRCAAAGASSSRGRRDRPRRARRRGHGRLRAARRACAPSSSACSPAARRARRRRSLASVITPLLAAARSLPHAAPRSSCSASAARCWSPRGAALRRRPWTGHVRPGLMDLLRPAGDAAAARAVAVERARLVAPPAGHWPAAWRRAAALSTRARLQRRRERGAARGLRHARAGPAPLRARGGQRRAQRAVGAGRGRLRETAQMRCSPATRRPPRPCATSAARRARGVIGTVASPAPRPGDRRLAHAPSRRAGGGDGGARRGRRLRA